MTVDKKTGQKTEYTVSQKDFGEWVEAYPAVDVPQALRSMRQWTLSNLDRAKKDRGIRRFITNWLDREQNRGGNIKPQAEARSRGAGESARRMTFAEQEERRNQLNRAGGVLKFDGEAKFLEYCKTNNINPDEARAWNITQ